MADRRLFCHAGCCIIMMEGGEHDAGSFCACRCMQKRRALPGTAARYASNYVGSDYGEAERTGSAKPHPLGRTVPEARFLSIGRRPRTGAL